MKSGANLLGSVFKAGGVYFFFTLLNRAIPFLLIPLLTRYIDPTGYGIISVLGVVTAIATPLIGFCGNTVLYQRYHQVPLIDRPLLVNDCYKIVIFGAIAVMSISSLFPNLPDRYLGVGLFWFELTMLTAAAGMTFTLSTSLYQIKMQPLRYGILQFTSSVTNALFAIILVVVVEGGWQGRLWSICLAAVFSSLISVYLVLKHGDLDVNRFRDSSEIKTVVRLGSALIPATIAGGVVSMSDRLFLNGMTTLEIVGIYAVGFSFAQITDVILNSIGQAYLPYIYKHGRDTNRIVRLRFVQVILAVTVLSLSVAMLITVVAPFVLQHIVDVRFHDAHLVIGWLSLSFAFISINAPFQGLILSVNRNTVTIYISLITTLVSVVSSYLLISEFGMKGAAMSVALASFTSLLLHVFASQRYNSCPWFDPGVFTDLIKWRNK